MGKINVVRPDGTVVSVDEDLYRQAVGQPGVPQREGVGGELARKAEEEKRQQQENAPLVEKVGGALSAGAIGAADTLSFGAAGKGLEALSNDDGAGLSQFLRGHSTAYGVGSVGAMLAPTGWIGGGAKALSELTALGGAARAGEAAAAVTGSRALGHVVEGGLIGAGAHVASTTVTGDPLTIEGSLEAAGVGAFIGLGAGVLGDKLTSVGKRAKDATAKATALQESVETAKKGAALLDKGPVDSQWNYFKDTLEAQQKAERQALTRASAADDAAAGAHAAAVKRYDSYAGSNKQLTYAVKKTEGVVNEIADYWSPRTPEVQRTETLSRTQSENVTSRYGKSDGLTTRAGENRDLISGDTSKFSNEGRLSAEGTTESNGLVDQYGRKVVERIKTDLNKSVMSEAMEQRLKGFRERISQIYRKKSGGFELEGGTWKKNPAVKADPQGALEDLRKLNEEITAQQAGAESPFSKASGNLAELPPHPGPPPVRATPTGAALDEALKAGNIADLPGTPLEFARMRPESAERIANAMSKESAGAFDRFREQLGLEAGATPAETAAAVHAKLNEFVRATESVRNALAEEAQGGRGIVGWARRMANRGLKGAVMRAADVGGWQGAITRTAAGEVAGTAMNTVERSVFDAKLIEGKLQAQSKTRDLVAKWAERAGAFTQKLGPVEAYLRNSFDGTPDPENDVRKLAVNRINEIARTATTGPDSIFAAVENMLGHPGDIGWKIHQKLNQGLQFLQQSTPKDPGNDFKLTDSQWTPAWHEAIELAHRIEAFVNPFNAIARQLSGDGHPSGAESLWAHWPALMSEVGSEFAANVEKLANRSYDQLQGASQLFRTPLAGLHDPNATLYLQGLYAPKQEAGPSAGGKPGFGRPGAGPAASGKPGFGRAPRAVGRPAAVQSPVAGSSVSNLISQ